MYVTRATFEKVQSVESVPCKWAGIALKQINANKQSDEKRQNWSEISVLRCIEGDKRDDIIEYTSSSMEKCVEGKTRQQSFSPNSLVDRRRNPRVRPIVSPRELFLLLAWLLVVVVVVAAWPLPLFAPRASAAVRWPRSSRIYGAHGGRYVLWLIVLLSLTYFQFTAAAGHSASATVYCVWWTPLYVPPYYALPARSFVPTRDSRLRPAYRPTLDTRTDLLILSPSPFRTISAIYTDSANNFASNGSTTR